MLRVFKYRSPMSVGVWTLLGFSFGVTLAVITGELILRGYESNLLVLLSWAGQVAATLAGLLLVSYTGVLFGVTAVPVWSENRTLLPPQFVASGLGSAAGILELLGFLNHATQVMGFIAAGAETLIGTLIEVRRRPVSTSLCGQEKPAGPCSRQEFWQDRSRY